MPTPPSGPAHGVQALAAENAELRIRLQEMEDTLLSIQRGDVDALVVNDDIYTLESAHAAGNRMRQDVLGQMEDAVFAFDCAHNVIYLNTAAERRYGVLSADVLGRPRAAVFSESEAADAASAGTAPVQGAPLHSGAATHQLPNGTVIQVESAVSELTDAAGNAVGWLAVVRDVTERARNAAALRASEQGLREANETLEARVEARTQALQRAEEALRQSQKMEAVGQLTGGIAHDFNNLLAAISGSLQVLQARLAQRRLDGLDRYIDIGQGAVRRAASLTQRLLAFARRQTLAPKPTDVSQLVVGMQDLIARSAGPNVNVAVHAASGLWVTRVDPSQLENALLNLCINARDAMQPQGGQLRIATSNEQLDAAAAVPLELAPGDYVCLCVTDSGSGMSAELIQRIFDPFFTTKPLGHGTGLGLSMVYGFVRQSGGQVHVASTPGSGTAMRLYLPRHLGAAPLAVVPEAVADIAAGAGETLVVIEDEDSIRMLIDEVLTEAGYKVICHGDGPSAMPLLESDAQIDLLITDVGLPGGMNGRQVADQARATRPGLKVLFITGYAENTAITNGWLDDGMAVLTKPFEIAALAHAVRAMTTGQARA